jgi:hypothetical protein
MQNYMLPSPIAALAMYLLCFSRSERDSLRSIFGRLVTLGSLRAASGSTSFSQWLITLSECALHSTKPVSARWGARRGGWCTFSFVGCHPKSTFSPPHQAPDPALLTMSPLWLSAPARSCEDWRGLSGSIDKPRRRRLRLQVVRANRRQSAAYRYPPGAYSSDTQGTAPDHCEVGSACCINENSLPRRVILGTERTCFQI